MTEWAIGQVLDAVASAVPDRVMTVCGDRRSTFAESAVRTRRWANFLADRGLGVNRDDAERQRWECGQDRVALLLRNDLYLDVLLGCLKARTVPVNVNPSYTAPEIADLVGYLRPSAVVYHRGVGPVLNEAVPDRSGLLSVVLDDGSDAPELPDAVPFAHALECGDPDRVIETSPDDLAMLCTGGTTGRPKGVLWRQADLYVSAMNGADHESMSVLHDFAQLTGQSWFAVSPLSHAAGVFTACAGLLAGQTIVLYDDRERFDAGRALVVAEQERVALMTIVGDAYAGPLVAELRRRHYDLSGLFGIGTGGAATNPVYRRALLELLPHVTLIEGYGSSETGGMGFGRSTRGAEVETFAPMPGGAAISADRTRFLQPGDEEIGWAARIGRVPMGYLDDREATLRTFPEIDGQRVAVPGDRVQLAADGTIRLFGRDALVINTGGEKVFVEEVEEVLRAIPEIVDALVVGRPSRRWGTEVVALICGAPIAAELLRSRCRERLAGYKVPKDFLAVPEIRRLGNGKPDYRWARARAAAAGTESRP
ncbi:AMP-binding protein [Skermania piniformis]|uniref:AMP-binding protein n=1 Tax=Skermania pinensis TaxID=39122 RepID=A0ABX8S529_9ACTN|nr:AMP-binding protein [Skermania piniformis]QXQ12948.1 AMP-binding protein [Skermania piniformis]